METELTINRQHINDVILDMTVINQLTNTIIVDSPIGEIEITTMSKSNKEVITEKKRVAYKLPQHRLIMKSCKYKKCKLIISDIPNFKTIETNKTLCETASYGINESFLMYLKNSKKVERNKIVFFDQSFIKKIFNKMTEDILINKIIESSVGFSWMIIPKEIFLILKKNKSFNYSDKSSSKYIFKNYGNINGVNVYINYIEYDMRIYFGNYDSITAILNENIEIKKIGDNTDKSITLEYQFLETGNLKILEIE